MNFKKKSVELLVDNLNKEFVTIKAKDSKIYFSIYNQVIDKLIETMKSVDKAFNSYKSKVQIGGSQYDDLKITKPNEYDVNIVIKLPISYADSELGIQLEYVYPAYAKVKISKAFDNLRKHTNWEEVNVVTLDWRNENGYLLQNKFRSWMESVVQKALNEMKHEIVSEDDVLKIVHRKSGPANTIEVRSMKEDIEISVDLVPVLQFEHPRWPCNYRHFNDISMKHKQWYVVPKPYKGCIDPKEQNQLWRLSFPEQERLLIKGFQQLKPCIRLIKKLRDGLCMKDLASYFIKTLFLWEVENNVNKAFWDLKFGTIFRHMVGKLHDAMVLKEIKFYWKPEFNLLSGIKDGVLDNYRIQLNKFIKEYDDNNATYLIANLLTPEEVLTLKSTPDGLAWFEPQIVIETKILSMETSRTESSISTSNTSPPILDQNNIMSYLVKLYQSNKNIEEKVSRLENSVLVLEETLNQLKILINKTSLNN